MRNFYLNFLIYNIEKSSAPKGAVIFCLFYFFTKIWLQRSQMKKIYHPFRDEILVEKIEREKLSLL